MPQKVFRNYKHVKDAERVSRGLLCSEKKPGIIIYLLFPSFILYGLLGKGFIKDSHVVHE